ncbi:MAG: efflux RND transporter periplasmic adaptor subunit [Phycisphaerales bacterium]|nr:efflux RND transporter periplasmic adaptor subunit [Phycisphaerales bacterium]
MWKWLLGIALVLLLGCVGSGYWMVSSGQYEKLKLQFSGEGKATLVRLEPVLRGTLTKTVSAPGLIEPRTKVEISAQVSARIIALPFREGQEVKKDDVVIRLDADDLAARVDSAKARLNSTQAALEGAKATYQNATGELTRRKELFDTKDISKAELDQAEEAYRAAESRLRQAEFSIDIARADLSAAEKDLSNAVIVSPFDGVITKLDAEVGELVVVGTLNNPGSVIMEIADLTDMLMKAKVDEANVAPVQPAQTAKVFINAYPERTFTATVERVKLFRQLDKDGTAYFETELKLDIPDGMRLRSGLTANADIGVETLREVMLVPSQSVVDRNIDDLPKDALASEHLDKAKKFARVAYVFSEGKVLAKPVSIGPSDLTKTVILGGLAEGDRIVAGPYKALVSLKDGQKVEEDTGHDKAQPPQQAEKTAAEKKEPAQG